MDIYFLGMVMSGAPFVPVKEIEDQQKQFYYYVGGMEFIHKALKKLKTAQTGADIAGVWNNMVQIITELEGRPESDELYATWQVLKSVRSSIVKAVGDPDTLTAAQLLASKNAIRKEMRMKHQIYWIRWLQGFFCSKIERAYQAAENGMGMFGKRLYVAVLPEFSILDLPFLVDKNVGFYSRVTQCMIDGAEYDLPSRTGRLRPMTFCSLTKKYSGGSTSLLVLPGTILWKTNQIHAVYYNTATAFWEGRCIHVWDKQLISPGDGICSVPKRMHPQPGDADNPTASQLTQNFLTSIHQSVLQTSPIFSIQPFGKTVSFLILICIDKSRADFFAGGGNADFCIHMACGSDMSILMTRSYPMIAQKWVLYCDCQCIDLHGCVVENQGIWPMVYADFGEVHTRNEWANRVSDHKDKIPDLHAKYRKEIFMYLFPQKITLE